MPKATIKTQFCQIATPKNPFKFRDGGVIDDVRLAYETWGTLNEKRDNVILVFHALSGSHHAAGHNPTGPGDNPFWTDECHGGWWDSFIGPGKALNTKKFFVICANWVGGCYGSTGPSSINPKTGKPYGSKFPWFTISDIVDSQVRLLEQLGIKKVFAAIGASLGGFCVLDFAARYADRVKCVIQISSGVRATVIAKAMNFEQIYAIEQDPNFKAGEYYDGPRPDSGLALARMISHKTFVSLSYMENRARKEIRQPTDTLTQYKIQHQVESYLLHQGQKFVKRFDANSYIRIVNCWQSFNMPEALADGDLVKAIKPCKNQDWVVFSINSDACFYPEEQAELAVALKANGMDYQHITVHSDKGHDSFLIEPELFSPYISFKLNSVHERLEEEPAPAAARKSSKPKKG